MLKSFVFKILICLLVPFFILFFCAFLVSQVILPSFDELSSKRDHFNGKAILDESPVI